MTFKNIENYYKSEISKNKNIGLIIGNKTDYYASSTYIRLLSPLNELTDKYTFHIVDNETIQLFYEDLTEANLKLDLIIIQRDIILNPKFNNLEFLNLLFKMCKKNNIKIIFDIDDDLINIDKTHIDYEIYNNVRSTLYYIINNSDIITVPTTILRQKLLEFNAKLTIIIIPNTLINLWDFNSNFKKTTGLKSKKIIKIGYFGGNSHAQDIKLIENAIINTKLHFPNKKIILEVIGINKELPDWMDKIIIPHNYNTSPNLIKHIKNLIYSILQKFNIITGSLPFYSFVDWMKNEINWDIGIAPLEDNNINQSKSNLKYLEYTALGVPGIYSNIGPYKEIKNKNTGLVVNNDSEEWEKSIIQYIENDDLYISTLNNAIKDVGRNYLVTNSTSIWETLLDKLLY